MSAPIVDNLVLFPRYTTLAGDGTYTTQPIHVTAYDRVVIVAWRGKITSGSGCSITIEASVDRETWVTLAGNDPGEDTELQFASSLTKPWLRGKAKVELAPDFPVVSCWAVGELYRRRR